MFPLKPGKTTKTLDSKPKSPRESHTQHTKFGMGNNYGTGAKAPVGKIRSATVGFKPVTKKQLGTPPKSVV